jgi:hypothetical protein
MRSTVRALNVANEYLESGVTELMKAVPHAYARGGFHTNTDSERSMTEVPTTSPPSLPLTMAAASELTDVFIRPRW